MMLDVMPINRFSNIYCLARISQREAEILFLMLTKEQLNTVLFSCRTYLPPLLPWLSTSWVLQFSFVLTFLPHTLHIDTCIAMSIYFMATTTKNYILTEKVIAYIWTDVHTRVLNVCTLPLLVLRDLKFTFLPRKWSHILPRTSVGPGFCSSISTKGSRRKLS